MEILKYITGDVIKEFRRVSEALLDELDIDKKTFPINIYEVAYRCGLRIEYDGNLKSHARLSNGVITLNRDDEESQKRFSVAHELVHILVKDFLAVDLVENETGVLISFSYKNRELRNVARDFGKTKSIDVHKDRPLLLRDLYEEVIDYCAAQLLIPCGYFSLHIDESDDKLAEQFGVKCSCIRKRRVELPYELDVFAPVSFSDVVETDAASAEEADSIMESW